MAYHQNGRQPYSNAGQAPGEPTPASQQNPYSRDRRYYENEGDNDDTAFGARNDGHSGHGLGRSTTAASRQNEELFVGPTGSGRAPYERASTQPIPLPMPSYPQDQYGQSASSGQQSYNPQLYAQTASQPQIPVYTTGISRAYTTTTAPQTYNPAAYHEDYMSRHTSVVSRPQGYQPGTHTTSSAYNSQPHPSYSPNSPPYSQSSFHSLRNQPGYGYPSNPPARQFSHASNNTPPSHGISAYSPPAPPPVPVPPGHEGYFEGHSISSQHGQSPNGHEQLHYNQQSRTDSLDQHSLPPPPVSNSQRFSFAPASGAEQYAPPAFYHPANPLPPTPAVSTPPQLLPQRMNTTGRHPQERPLPGPPSESDDDSDYFARPNGPGSVSQRSEQEVQDSLFDEVENAVRGPGGRNSIPLSSPRIEVDDFEGRRETSSRFQVPTRNASDRNNDDRPNGHSSPRAEHVRNNYDLGIRDAGTERQDAEDDSRLFPGASMQRLADSAPARDTGSDSDYGLVDMGSYGGGFDPHASYSVAAAEPAAGYDNTNGNRTQSQPISSPGSLRAASDTEGYEFEADAIHPFPPFTTARVDRSGTGGLAEPTARPTNRRASYDEGDESGWMDVHRSDSNEPPEMFYHPGISSERSRPLPPPPDARPEGLMPAGTYPSGASYPIAPDAFGLSVVTSDRVPRSTSLLNHSSTPTTVPPMRSKTDAEERRLRQQNRTGTTYGTDSGGESVTPPGASAIAIDLPSIPAGKRFNPSKLTAADFKRCAEPWALSSLVFWLRSMAEGEEYLKEHAIVEGLVALFTHKVPTMNIADAETLSARVVQDFYKAGVLLHEEEWLKFGRETSTGILYQLTGAGCYSSKLHEYPQSGRCYSHHCQRTVKKIDLQAQPAQSHSDDWATYYKIKKEDIENVDKKEMDKQNVLHEIVMTEEGYMGQLRVLQVVYYDALASAHPPVIAPKRLNGFLRDVFGKLGAIKKANEEYLLPQLKYRQQEQGPFILGFSDIFREWIRRAKAAYIEYASAFPRATFVVRQEADRNMLFRTFLEQGRAHEISKKLGWDTYLKAPITRLQRYSLLLSVVHGKMLHESEEKTNLQAAMEEIRAVTMECDARVAEMNRKVDLTDLQTKLVLRPEMQGVELNLDHLGRQLIFKGDLQRTGANRFTWLETHALLFDHYLVLAKMVRQRDSAGSTKYERYDVSRWPIPMDLLILESRNDDPIIKRRAGFTAVADVARGPATPDARLGKTTTGLNGGPGTLTHTNTTTSIASDSTASSAPAVTALPGDQQNDNILYPFRIKHLGKDVYTLYAQSSQNRDDWCDKILEAKRKHAASLFAQNAEPFRLRVIADSAFAYEGGAYGQKSIIIKGTPMDRAIEEVEKLYVNSGRPSPVCRARVNCATAFIQPYGKPMLAIGTDFGVFISEMDDPRGWIRAIPIQRVTQVAVLEEFSLFLLISDKSLVAYHLDIVCPVGGGQISNDSARRAPQKLSGSRDVGFFATGRMKDRMLVFYKKRDGISSTFKVLEPVFQKSTEKKSRFLRSGRTEFFREFDEFYIPTECYSINLFHSSLAISTAKGFEVMTLDKKQPWSVPDLKEPHVASIASRLAGQDPLGMFRLSDQEFLLCYTECAVYVNKHGDVSRSVIMEFVGKARSAALYGPYVLLFDQDFVEIRNAQNGRLRQVIPGRDVKCLDDALSGGSAGKRTIKVCMQHPEQERYQVVVELLLNEGQKE